MATDLLGYVLISVVYCNYSMTFLNLFKRNENKNFFGETSSLELNSSKRKF